MSDKEQSTDGSYSMFNSVWVKIEVNHSEEEEGNKGDNLAEQSEVDDEQKSGAEDKLTDQSDSPDETPVKQARKRTLNKRKRSPGQQSLLCDLCDYSSRHYTSLQRHIIGQHQAKDKSEDLIVYRCPLCPYESIFKSNYTAHQKRKHTTEKRFKCDFCDYKTSYRNNIVKHSKTHRKKEEQHAYQCDKCTFFTKFEGHMGRHLAIMHSEVSDKATKCDYCNFATKARWRLNTHTNRSRKDNPINCPSCDFSTMFMCEYKRHKAVHQAESLNHTNFSATLDTNYQEILTKKRKQTDSDKTNQYVIDTESEVDWKSIPVTELPGQERLFKCTMCDYLSKFKASVQRHYYRLHTDSKKPYKCLNCDYSSKTKDKIVLHSRRSKSTTALGCSVCDFSTFFKCQQVMHQKSHNKFKCDFCNYSCANSWNLERHISSGHQNNGIKCKYCEYRAAGKESLICHEATHTGIKPFRCEECDYSSAKRQLLDTHVKRRHPKINQEIVYFSDSKFEQLKVDTNCSESN